MAHPNKWIVGIWVAVTLALPFVAIRFGYSAGWVLFVWIALSVVAEEFRFGWWWKKVTRWGGW